MKISKYLRPDRISLDLKKTDKSSVVREVAELLKTGGGINDFDGFYSEILERERISNTALGHEVALPHARTDRVSDIIIAVGCIRNGLDFGAHDKMPVKFVFLIGTPKRMVTDYLRIVGALARLMKQPDFRAKLLESSTAEEFIDVFRQVEQE